MLTQLLSFSDLTAHGESRHFLALFSLFTELSKTDEKLFSNTFANIRNPTLALLKTRSRQHASVVCQINIIASPNVNHAISNAFLLLPFQNVFFLGFVHFYDNSYTQSTLSIS